MALIGNITNRGYIQGHINEANGILTGVITNSGQLGGQVVGMRGLKGDKGETGDTGATGATGNGIASISKTGSSGNIDTYTITYTNGGTVTFTVTNGIDGHSPTITASKVGKTTTIYADGVSLGTIIDGADGIDGVDGVDGTDGVGISSITKTSTSGLVDTYTITFTDTNTTTFDVTNGKDGVDGVDGTDGVDGQDGYSPTATVTKSGDTATITITDKNGTTTQTISDGTDGTDGQDGQDGEDGYSPSASVTKSGSVATISITDKNGTTSASVSDGNGVPSGGTAGQVLTKHSATDYDVSWADASGGGAYIVTFTYDNQNETWSCDKTAQEIYEACESGKIAIGICDNSVFPCNYFSDDGEEDSIHYYSALFARSMYYGYGNSLVTDEFYVNNSEVERNTYYVDPVSESRKINNKPLSSDITLTASDVGALPDTTTIPSKTSDLTNDSGFITGMTILSYGNSTWQNFIDAYNANKVVYCRASSNSNPASGSQTRLAFMAYVNNATTPTEVEFQYYRSVSTHTASQQGDQVFVYKLNKTNGWSVTTREASSKVVAGTGLSSSYSSGVLTLTSSGEANVQSDWSQSDTTADDYIKNKPTIPTVNNATLTIQKNGTTVNTFTANASSNVTANISVPTQASDIGAQPTLVSGTNIKTINSESLLGSGNITLSAEDEIFYCVYGTTTLAEAVTEYNAGKTLVCRYTDLTDVVVYAPLIDATFLNGSVEGFAFSVGGYGSYLDFLLSPNGWTLTEMSATSTPTNNKLPLFDTTAHMNSTDMTSQEVSDFVDDLSYESEVATVISDMVDYIVEQGTSGSWTYRKWNSGIAECWASYSATVSANAIDTSAVLQFPFSFTAIPCITIGTVGGGADYYRTHVELSTTSASAVRLVLINKYTSAVTIGSNIHAIGRWK